MEVSSKWPPSSIGDLLGDFPRCGCGVKLSKFNKLERAAITTCLEYKAVRETFTPEVIKEAIRLYWKVG